MRKIPLPRLPVPIAAVDTPPCLRPNWHPSLKRFFTELSKNRLQAIERNWLACRKFDTLHHSMQQWNRSTNVKTMPGKWWLFRRETSSKWTINTCRSSLSHAYIFKACHLGARTSFSQINARRLQEDKFIKQISWNAYMWIRGPNYKTTLYIEPIMFK